MNSCILAFNDNALLAYDFDNWIISANIIFNNILVFSAILFDVSSSISLKSDVFWWNGKELLHLVLGLYKHVNINWTTVCDINNV